MRALPTGTFDWAIPLGWVQHVRASIDLGDRRCNGNIVWDYSEPGMIFGSPFATTPEGQSILADLAANTERLKRELAESITADFDSRRAAELSRVSCSLNARRIKE